MTFREEVGSEGPVPSAAEGGPPGPLLCLLATSFLCPSPARERTTLPHVCDPRWQHCGRRRTRPTRRRGSLCGSVTRAPSCPLPYSRAFHSIRWFLGDRLGFSFSRRTAGCWLEWTRSWKQFLFLKEGAILCDPRATCFPCKFTEPERLGRQSAQGHSLQPVRRSELAQ